MTHPSSESVYPKLMEQLEKFGVRPKVTGFVLPLGYSFNLDGSMIYTTFAAIFIAQAYGIDMPLSAQITMLLVLMVSSKGIVACRALRSSWWWRCCPCSTCQRPVCC